jgi:hypothetical protein
MTLLTTDRTVDQTARSAEADVSATHFPASSIAPTAHPVASPYRDSGYLGLSPRLLSMEDAPAIAVSFAQTTPSDTRRQMALQLLKRALYH